MDEIPILEVLDRETPVLDGNTSILEVLDGLEVIEVLDRETPVLPVLDGFEVIEVIEVSDAA